jgi:hypothetical protein
MKYKEIHHSQDGQETTQEFHLDFEKGRSQVCYSLVPTVDEPVGVKIIESGWRDGGPLFHILVEYGDFMETDYLFGNMNFVCEKFPQFREIYETKQPDVVISGQEIQDMRNDAELGHWTRRHSNQMKNSYSSFRKAEDNGQLELPF